jgi:hypothetical protein
MLAAMPVSMYMPLILVQVKNKVILNKIKTFLNTFSYKEALII